MPDFIQTFIFVEAILIIIIGLFYTFYLHKKEKELKNLENDTGKKLSSVTEDAHFRAKMIIDHAVKKAEEILGQTEFLKADMTNDARKKVNKLAQTYLESFKAQSNEAGDSYKKALHDIYGRFLDDEKMMMTEMEQIKQQELQSFKNTLKEDTTTAGTYLQKKVETEFEKTQLEIENYKKEKLQNIDKAIEGRVRELATQVLGKTINVQDHQKLIIEALEKAKKEGIIA